MLDGSQMCTIFHSNNFLSYSYKHYFGQMFNPTNKAIWGRHRGLRGIVHFYWTLTFYSTLHSKQLADQ